MALRPALAALLTLLTILALPAVAAPAAPAPKANPPLPSKASAQAPAPTPAPTPASAPASAPAPAEPGTLMALHYMAGTGVCASAHSADTRVDNPCWLQLGLVPAIRIGALELGIAYEGRDLLKWVSFTLLQAPSVSTVGASAAWVVEPDERWRLSLGGEAGWRRYMDFAGSGISHRSGNIDLPYLGAVGRAGLGVRPGSGRADRLEVSVAVRADLKHGHATVEGVDWAAGGWSFTMSLGLISEW